jgi:probable HAF family extracellular repeat protein
MRSARRLLLLLSVIAACLTVLNFSEAKKPDKPGDNGGKGSAYTIVPFQPSGYVSIFSRVVDLNETGGAVGYAEDEDGMLQAFHLDIENADYSPLQDGDEAFGVNNLNQIVGRTKIDGVSMPLFWRSPTANPVLLPALPGDVEADAFAINDAGIVVGRSWAAGGFAPVGVVWRVLVDANGNPQIDGPRELAPLAGDIVSGAADVNEVVEGSAQVVGGSYDGLLSEAVIWSVSLNPDESLAAPGAAQGLGTLGIDDPSQSEGFAINNLGAACGQSDRWPFLAPANQVAQELHTPRKTISDGLAPNTAMDVNDAGDIVGRLYIDRQGSRAYLWRNGKTIDLNTQIPSGNGWDQLYGAVVINSAGTIGGWGRLDGAYLGFLLIPNEP